MRWPPRGNFSHADSFLIRQGDVTSEDPYFLEQVKLVGISSLFGLSGNPWYYLTRSQACGRGTKAYGQSKPLQTSRA